MLISTQMGLPVISQISHGRQRCLGIWIGLFLRVSTPYNRIKFFKCNLQVRFVCSEPKVMISSITELSTCRYALTVQCPMLCKHPYVTVLLYLIFHDAARFWDTALCWSDLWPQLCRLYQEERPVWHTINCNSLPKKQNEKGVEEEKMEDNRIIMVRDTKNPSSGDAFE